MREVPGSIPVAGEEKFGVRTHLCVICRDEMNMVRCPSDRDLN